MKTKLPRILFFVFLLGIYISGQAQIITAPDATPVPPREALPEEDVATDSVITNRPKKRERYGPTDHSTAYLMLYGAGSIPLGDYGSTSSFTLPLEGKRAKPGFDVGLDFGKTFYKFIGIGISAGFTAHPSDFGYLQNFLLDINYSGYKQLYATVGPLFSVNIRDMVRIDIKPQIGFGYCIDDEATYTFYDTSLTLVNDRITGGNSFSMMPAFGFSVRRNLTDIWSLAFNFTYRYASYTIDERKYYQNNNYIGDFLPYDINAHMLNLGFGIGASF
ncbi:MAG: hypothetical protein SFW35_10650 [Chitinophagales bacterium]|nr:hypothetical protein [Chitinophagales bacterium]